MERDCMLKKEETIAELVKVSRKEKNISARKLASLVGVSHTEINNIVMTDGLVGIVYKDKIQIINI